VKIGKLRGDWEKYFASWSDEADERDRIRRFRRRSFGSSLKNGQAGWKYGQPLFGIRPSRKKK